MIVLKLFGEKKITPQNKVLWSSNGVFSIFKNTLEQIKHTQNVLLTGTFSFTSFSIALWKCPGSMGTPVSGLCVGIDEQNAHLHRQRGPWELAAGRFRHLVIGIYLVNPFKWSSSKMSWRRANLCFHPVNAERWFSQLNKEQTPILLD